MELVKCNNLCKEFDNKQILCNINPGINSKRIISYLPERTYLDIR